MEIQQHDGVVVEVAGSRQGFAKLLREREVLQGRWEAPKAVSLLPSPLYIGPWGGAPAPRGPCAKRRGNGRVLKGEGTSEVPWGGGTPPWPHPSLEEGPKLHPPSPLALYIVGGREGNQT